MRSKRDVAVQLYNTVIPSNSKRRISWWIWAAKHNSCPKCKARPYQPCINLTIWAKELRRVRTKSPHEERVDWGRLVMGLRDRGYISEDIYRQTLELMERAA